MSTALTIDGINKFVRRSLGAPVIDVELHDDQITEFIEQALGIYGTHKPVEKLETINVLPGTQKYHIVADKIGRGIIEIFRPDLLRSPVSLDQFDVFKYHTHLPNLDPGDYYLERIWWDEVRISAGSDDDWEFVYDPTTGEADLYISPPPSEGYTLSYYYVVDPTLIEVPPTDDDWIKEYTLAMCKETLGLIRSKFTNVQGAESSLDMDGEMLRGEGREERKDLEEYLTGRGQVIPPIRG
jgi:hypothetical protein